MKKVQFLFVHRQDQNFATEDGEGYVIPHFLFFSDSLLVEYYFPRFLVILGFFYVQVFFRLITSGLLAIIRESRS